MGERTFLLYVTFPDHATAEAIVRMAVEQRLAACGNVLPGVRSIYRWKGAIETADEVLVFFKTTEENLPAVRQCILGSHPYEVPEIVATPIVEGNPAYLAWVRESCGPVGKPVTGNG
jgi:periplasmic divalent cation tolerance protein